MFVLWWSAFSQPKDRQIPCSMAGSLVQYIEAIQSLLIKSILGQSTSQYIVTHGYSNL